MLYAFVSLWFCLSGNPSHINQESFAERVKYQKVARASAVTSVLIHCFTVCPEEAWAVQDVGMVRHWSRVKVVVDHGVAIRPLCQLPQRWLMDCTEDNLPLRQVMVALVIWRDPTRAKCATVQNFLVTGKWWEREMDCNYQPFTDIWDLTAGEIRK